MNKIKIKETDSNDQAIKIWFFFYLIAYVCILWALISTKTWEYPVETIE